MRAKEKSTRVIFVRHGETNFPTDRIYCDNLEDPPLSDIGLDQARATAKILSHANVAAICSSPCSRTKMTAEEIAGYQEIPISLDGSLVERNFGVWEGLYFHEIESGFPEQFREWKRNQAEFKPDGGESVFEMADRVRPVLSGLVKEYVGKCVVVVAHVGPIRVMVAEALGVPIEKYRQLGIDPASITCIDYGLTQNNLILLNFHPRHRFC
jgi:broad specificity phosphatase PhoE